MAFTYTWAVTSLKVKDEINAEGDTLTNAVVQTYWKVTGTDENGNTGEFSGATPFSAANVPAGSFKAFEDLVEADVIDWIQNVVNNDAAYKSHIDGQIQKIIDVNTVVEKAADELPWATPAAAEEVTE
jgi:hypothetical protein